MKLFVSVSVMRRGFTLIEVMVAVMIISVVIATLLQMRGNSTHLFLNMDKKSKINQFSSFFIANDNYGYETKTTSLDELVANFEIENDLRRELRDTNVEIIYQELSIIDLSDFSSSESEDNYQTQKSEAMSTMVFEIGKTILKTKDSSVALLRLKRQ